MTTRIELLEDEVHSVNEQLYASYKHIAELNARIAELEKLVEADGKEIGSYRENTGLRGEWKEKDALIKKLMEEIQGTIMTIAQADTGGTLSNHEDNRVRMLVFDAKNMTIKYGFFNYWD